MPLPEDAPTWAGLDVMFATTSGTVRRNKLSDFVNVRRSGIIAMKLDEGEAIVMCRFAPSGTTCCWQPPASTSRKVAPF